MRRLRGISILIAAVCIAMPAFAQAPAAKRPAAKRPATKQAAAKPVQSPPEWTRADMRAFLLNANITASRDTSKGVTAPKRLTLSDGKRTHDAAFQSVDELKPASANAGTPNDKFELSFIDSYKFNLAAYGLAELLGIAEMMPVHVEREWNGRKGSLSWWVDVQFDEEDRRKKNVQPPNGIAYTHQMYRMRVFSALIRDTDRNLGNILYTPDWRVIMIDFTRAFRINSDLINQKDLTIVDRRLLKNIESLTAASLKAATGNYLTNEQQESVMKRRTALLEHYRKRIADIGEAKVLY